MAARTTLNFAETLRMFRDLTLTGSPETRAKADAIVRILTDLIGAPDPPETPLAPEELDADGLQNSVSLAWLASDGAAAYKVYRGLNQADFQEVARTTETSFLDLGLLDETQYFYFVTAVGINEAESLPSNVATTSTLPDDTVVAPEVPTGFEVGSVTYSAVNLQWDELINGNVAIEIQRQRPAASTPEFVTIATSTIGTSYVDTQVQEGETYEYRARGLNVVGDASAFTSTETAVVPNSDTTAPGTPTGLTLTPGETSIVATADQNTESDMRGYRFQAGSTSGGPYVDYGERAQPGFRIPNLTPNSEYYVVVSAIDTSGNESAPTDEVSTTTLEVQVGDTIPPPRVDGIVVVTQESGEVDIAWNEVEADDLDGYDIEVSLPPQGSMTGPFSFLQSENAGESTTRVTDLDPTERYFFRVIAKDTTGNPADPSPAFAITPDGSDGPSGNVIVISPDKQTNTRVEGEPVRPGGGPSNPDGGSGGSGGSVGSGGSAGSGGSVGSGGSGGSGGGSGGNDPTAGITADGSQGSTVHQYENTTAESNKSLFLPGMRAARAPRSGQNIPTTHQYSNALSYANTSFLGNYNATYNTGKPSGLPKQVRADMKMHVMDNVEFTAWAWEGDISGTSKWSIQDYDQPASLTRDCDFESALSGPQGYYAGGTPTGFEGGFVYPGRVEHDRYHHSLRPVIWQRVTSNFVGGHTCYIAGRPFSYDQYAPDCSIPTRAPVCLIDNCHLVDSNIFFGKGSNKVEIFDYGTPTDPGVVFLRNSTLIDAFPYWVVPNNAGNAWHYSLDDPKPTAASYRSMGLLNVSGYQWAESPEQSNQTGIDLGYDAYQSPGGYGSGEAPTKLVLVKNCLLQQVEAGKSMCGFGGVKDVRFEDSTLITDGTNKAWGINSQGYRADDPTTTRGLPRVETITFANCVTRGVRLVFNRMSPGTSSTDQIYVDVPEDLRGKILTYTISKTVTGAAGITVNGGTLLNPDPPAYDEVADAYDIAGEINSIDPLAEVTGIPTDFAWDIPGVTV